MQTFYFHVQHPDGHQFHDDQGEEFRDLDCAEEQAMESLRGLVAAAEKRGDSADGLTILIAGEDGSVLETIEAREVFQ